MLYPNKQNQLLKHFSDFSIPEGISQNDEWTLICLLLERASNHFITQVELAEKLYVSIPTFRKLMSHVKEWFADHHIMIQTIPGKGLTLVGDEYSKRVAIRDAILLQEDENKLLFCNDLPEEYLLKKSLRLFEKQKVIGKSNFLIPRLSKYESC